MQEKPMVRQLEQKLKELMPLRHFMITAYSRNGFFLLMKACGWKQPDEVIIPAFTCPVIKYTVAAARVVPVPVDAEKGGLNLDPDLLVQAITPNTKAIYVVHTYGYPAQIEKICSIAREHDLLVIEDLAHSLFTVHKGQQLGTYGDIAILSFTKQMINFEGGAVATNHTDIYEKMLQLRKEYQQPGKGSIGSLIDSYVRMTGAWWESSFSLPALGFMKFHDRLNSWLYQGSYGLEVDFTKFYASNLGCRLTLSQLARLWYKKRQLSSPGRPWQCRNEKTVSPYNTGLVSEQESLNLLLSFRTWHNPHEIGHYPRADHLYRQLRIFSRAKYHFREQPRAIPENPIQQFE